MSADHHATRKAPWFAVTVLGQPLGSDAMAAATGAIAAHGCHPIVLAVTYGRLHNLAQVFVYGRFMQIIAIFA